MRLGAAVLVALTVALLTAPGCAPSSACTLAGCQSGVKIYTTASSLPAGASMRTCRNAVCATAKLVAEDDAGTRFDALYDPQIFVGGCSAEPVDGGAGFAVACQVSAAAVTDAGASETETPLSESDRYTVSIVQGSTVTTLVDDTATYTTFQPNGPSCDPTCLEGTIGMPSSP